ncbi:MAG: GrpB family protein, partial [Lachnospiraceae bacterium]|nr:GrpB family protein [Lachnospiraceae bacterium]
MVLGCKRGTVELYDHDPEWETASARTIAQLKSVFGDAAVDIQHVGSTAIRSVKAKPIIDIAVGVINFDSVLPLIGVLEEKGFYKSKLHAISNDILLCDGNEEADTRSYHIHIVIYGSTQWKNYIRFRDYLNANSTAAHEYEKTKLELAVKYPNDRNAYTEGKDNVISQILRKAQVRALLGTIATVTVDRPAGTYHPRTNTIFYSINYGYLDDELAPDGSGLDVYIMGVSEPLKTFTGRVIGIIHRENDVEDKLVAAPDGMVFTQNEIGEAVHFVEKFYQTTIDAIYHKSAGIIVYRFMSGEPEYLVLFQHGSRTWSFPKGHMNAFETEEQAA